MITQPFRCSTKRGVLTLTLETPGCEVNIFSYEAATQLTEIMTALDPSKVRAVVIRSSKPGSFINGTKLMSATAVQSIDGAHTLSADTRRAYHSVRDAPVPTIAAIQGNCYGCGVEFTLNWDHRIAADTADTHFYMTEVNDYLFNPVFEGTVILPLMLGLRKSIDFLLWGERWTPEEARRRGLIDGVIDHRTFDKEVDRFVEEVIARGTGAGPTHRKVKPFKEDRDEAVIARARDRIRRLPPAHQKVYTDCLNLMVRAAKKGRVTEADCHREIILAGRSVSRPVSKSALSFFFIRQVAHTLCLGTAGRDAKKWHIAFDGEAEGLERFKADLAERRLTGASIQPNGGPLPRGGPKCSSYLLTDLTGGNGGAHNGVDPNSVAVALALSGEPLNGGPPMVLYNPFYPAGPEFFELAMRGRPTRRAHSLYKYLKQAGFQVVFSSPAEELALDRWITAYLAPLVAYGLEGGTAESVNETLRAFGFVHRPHERIRHLDRRKLVRLVADRIEAPVGEVRSVIRELGRPDAEGGRKDRRISDALTITLLGETLRTLEDRTLSHPTIIDVVAREVLDFPMQLGSLCRYLVVSRVEALLAGGSRFRHLVAPEDLERAERFVAGGRSFYQ